MRLQTVLVLVGILALAACSVSVDDDSTHKKADVEIRTPIGDVSVHTGVDAPDTGLAVYPGSTPLRDRREAESANVTVGNSLFGVNVAAAKFASDASADEVVRYYRQAMRAHGEVVECHGDINFRRSGPVCREGLFSKKKQTQLAVGTEERHRLVSVKPRGSGSEYSVVFVQTRS
jgi:hypothetical protein